MSSESLSGSPPGSPSGAERRDEVHFASRGSTYFDVILAAFCVVIVVSNIAATKGIEFGSWELSLGSVQISPVVTDGGAFLFPLAYILGDVISEVYGFRAARRAISTGFAMALVAAGTFWVVEQAPAASFYENQAAFESVAGPVAQIVLASVVGYVVGQFINSWVLVRMKQVTAERGLFSRLAASTGAGELADTFLFCAIASSAIGITSMGVFWNYFVVGVIYKVAVELIVMPLTMVVIGWLKRHEHTYWVTVPDSGDGQAE